MSARHRAAVIAIALYAGFMVLHVVAASDGGRVVTTLLPAVGPWLGPVGWAVYSAFAVVVAIVLRSDTGIDRRPAAGWLRPCLPLVLATTPFLLFGINLDSGSVVPLLIVGVPLVALNEELFYRGVLLDVLRPLGGRQAVLWSSLAFGAGHLANLASGSFPPFVAMQIAATTAGGVALAAIRIRSGSLWPPLVVHVVIDVIAISTLTGPATTSPILVPVLVGWMGANLLLWRYGWQLLEGATDVPEAPAPRDVGREVRAA